MAGEELIVAAIVLVFVVVILQSLVIARRYKKVAPDEAMVVFGRRKGDRGYQVITGGAKFIVPIVMSVRYMNIGAHTLRIAVPAIITRSGVPVMVDLVAVFKISTEREKLNTAVGQWLSKRPEEIDEAAKAIITGQVRGVCSKLEVEQINADREALGSDVREAVAPHFANMGLEILSLTVADVGDEVGYLEALGKRRTAEVKRDAIVAEATIRRQAIELAAEQDVESQKVRFKADAEIAAAQADRDATIEGYKKEAALRTARPR